MTERCDTLIVGGGIAGLSCARRLCDAGHHFTLVTDRLGGRMHHSADGSMNLGATYITEDYRHVSRYIDRGLPWRLLTAWAENDGRLTTLYHWRNLRFVGRLVPLIERLRELRRVLALFRRDAATVPQLELRAKYPLIDHYCRQSAAEVIGELRLGSLHEQYFEPAFRATCFVGSEAANALYYLMVLFPLILRIWMADFRRTYERLTAGYSQRIVLDRVTSMGRSIDGMWEAQTVAGRTFAARHVVIAAPYHNAREFYPVPKPHRTTSATALAVEGPRRAPYERKRFILVRAEETGASIIWRQLNGQDLVLAERAEPMLERYYTAPIVRHAVTWKTAITVSDANWVPLELEPDLYLAGDYNVSGLEDAFLTGLCAANRILARKPLEAAIG